MKIGEGSYNNTPPKPEDELRKSVGNFKQYLQEFNTAEGDDKKHALDRMGNEMTLMDAAGKSSDRKEVRNQEHKVAKDFQAFQESQTENNSKILEHDINVLGESLEH